LLDITLENGVGFFIFLSLAQVLPDSKWLLQLLGPLCHSNCLDAHFHTDHIWIPDGSGSLYPIAFELPYVAEPLLSADTKIESTDGLTSGEADAALSGSKKGSACSGAF